MCCLKSGINREGVFTMDEQKIKEQICEMGKRMYSRNMVAANDGNISVRVGEQEFL